jgi:Spermidine/putrescine-binding periplasmic protein
MIRSVLLGLLTTIFVSPLPAVELVVYNWPFYLAPEVKARFTQETGHTIKELYYDNEEARNTLLLSEHRPDIDLVITDYQTLYNPSWQHLYIDKNAAGLSHENKMEPRFLQACGNKATPYFWGGMGIAYRRDKVSTPITSWRQLLQPEPALMGHIVMVDDAFDLISIALKSEKHSINTDRRDEIKQAYDLLKAQSPYVLDYRFSLAALKDPAQANEVYAAVVYSGDFYSVRELSAYSDWTYIAPDEGSPLWIDCLAIPKESQHIKEAETLINFLQRPDIANLNGEKLGFTPTLQSRLLKEEIKQDPVAYPSAQHLKNAEYYSRTMELGALRNTIYFAVIK